MKNSAINQLKSQQENPPSTQGSYMISFEGIEGAGKSTQIQALKAHLEQTGKTVTILREPGGTTFGEKLREAILSSQRPLSPLAQAHLFASARAQLLFEKTLPLLEKPNNIVLYDRYLDSSLVYQGFAFNLGIDTILEIHKHTPLNYVPHKTIYLHLSVEKSLERIKKRGNEEDFFESQEIEFFHKLYEGHELVYGLFSERISKIEAERDEKAISQEIAQTVDKLIGR